MKGTGRFSSMQKMNVTQQLTKKDFLKKISDFESNPGEWNYKGDRPCIVDFYAEWCAPSKKIACILEELAKEYNGKIDIYKVDTDKEEDLMYAFGIKTIPSFLFCPINKNPKMAKGTMTKTDFYKAINDVLF